MAQREKKKVEVKFGSDSSNTVALEDVDEQKNTNNKIVAAPKMKKLQRLFGIDFYEDEEVVAKYNCQCEMTNGKFIITTRYILFNGTFPKKVMKTILLLDITTVEKKKTAMVLPNALEIRTKDNSLNFFSGFLHRDEVFNLVQNQRKIAEEKEEEMKKEQERMKREKTADEVSGTVKTYNLIKKMAPIVTLEEEPPKKKLCHPGCTIV